MKHKQDSDDTREGRKWFSNPFRLDFRSLALYRIAIGLVLLWDTISRWVDLSAHYTEQGVLKVADAEGFYASFSFSFHGLIDSPWWVSSLFLIQTVVAIALIIGYRTRSAVIVSFIMLVSLQNRNAILLNAGDVLFRVQLFWSIFLPLNMRFSLDLAHRRVVRTIEKATFSPATMAIVLQTVFLYIQTAVLKSGDMWRDNYEALYVALNAEAFTAPQGVWLSQFRGLMRAMTWAAIRMEDFVSIFILTPFMNSKARIVALVMIIGLHVGIMATMSVGIFQFISIATVLPLIPTFAWDFVLKFIEKRRPVTSLKVYYDHSCGICVAFIRLLSAFAIGRSITVENVYDNKEIAKVSIKHNSWVGVVGRKKVFKGDVFIEILKRSYLWWPFAPFLQIPVIHKILNLIYGFISSHRKSVCKPPKPVTSWSIFVSVADKVFGFTGQVATLVLLITIGVWVKADIPNQNNLQVSGAYRDVVMFLRLDQHWNMFSPNPYGVNSWYVVEGKTETGSVDVWRHYWDDTDELSFERPSHTFKTYVSPRWRRYLTRIQADSHAGYRESYMKYMCHDWNGKHPENQVSMITLHRMVEVTDLNGGEEPIEKVLQGEYECGLDN